MKKFHTKISASTLRKYCMSLNPGMGHDGVHSRFLKHASDAYLNNVAHFMNASFNHCFMAHDILKDIIPTIKDIRGDDTDSKNSFQ